jgi:hypothetical protein
MSSAYLNQTGALPSLYQLWERLSFSGSHIWQQGGVKLVLLHISLKLCGKSCATMTKLSYWFSLTRYSTDSLLQFDTQVKGFCKGFTGPTPSLQKVTAMVIDKLVPIWHGLNPNK